LNGGSFEAHTFNKIGYIIVLATERTKDNDLKMADKIIPSTFLKSSTAPYVAEPEDPYPSLSGYHDYEPQLEFDDSELLEVKEDDDILEEDDLAGGVVVLQGDRDYLESPMSDGTIEEDFEEALAKEIELNGEKSPTTPVVESRLLDATEDDFSDIAEHGIVEVVGDDKGGNKIIVVSACKLPPNKHRDGTVNFDSHRFLRYLMFTLDQYVDLDYSLVYFHHGLSSKNKPPLSWLWGAYKALDRRYKKNMKNLFIVHPTNFIKVVYNFFKPLISVKFGRKVQYVNQLSQLSQYMDLQRLPIPKSVVDHDRKVSRSSVPVSRSAEPVSGVGVGSTSWLPTQQFGVSIAWIADHHHSNIPPVMTKCIDFLSHLDCLETEGIFRRSANAAVVRELQAKIDRGEPVEFDTGDVHIAAVLLKTFLRELSQPLLTYSLFDNVLHFGDLPKESRMVFARDLVIKKLPDQNYVVLKFLVEFLSLVIDRCDMNKMTAANLAVVFGPNLIWSSDRSMSLTSIGPINTFTEYLLSNLHQIFIL